GRSLRERPDLLRRRRRNRPGNAQAKGPLGARSLESSGPTRPLADGAREVRLPKSLRPMDSGGADVRQPIAVRPRQPGVAEAAMSSGAPALSPQTLKRTPLHDAHLAAGARMVPFAGYDMPVQYRDGILKEHQWTRAHAGLFDVSHMGPAR